MSDDAKPESGLDNESNADDTNPPGRTESELNQSEAGDEESQARSEADSEHKSEAEETDKESDADPDEKKPPQRTETDQSDVESSADPESKNAESEAESDKRSESADESDGEELSKRTDATDAESTDADSDDEKKEKEEEKKEEDEEKVEETPAPERTGDMNTVTDDERLSRRDAEDAADVDKKDDEKLLTRTESQESAMMSDTNSETGEQAEFERKESEFLLAATVPDHLLAKGVSLPVSKAREPSVDIADQTAVGSEEAELKKAMEAKKEREKVEQTRKKNKQRISALSVEPQEDAVVEIEPDPDFKPYLSAKERLKKQQLDKQKEFFEPKNRILDPPVQALYEILKAAGPPDEAAFAQAKKRHGDNLKKWVGDNKASAAAIGKMMCTLFEVPAPPESASSPRSNVKTRRVISKASREEVPRLEDRVRQLRAQLQQRERQYAQAIENARQKAYQAGYQAAFDEEDEEPVRV